MNLLNTSFKPHPDSPRNFGGDIVCRCAYCNNLFYSPVEVFLCKLYLNPTPEELSATCAKKYEEKEVTITALPQTNPFCHRNTTEKRREK